MMTLTIKSSANGAGTPISTCADTFNRMISVETGLPSLRVYNLTTMAQVLSSTTLASPVGVTMIDSVSAVVHSSSVSTVDFIDTQAGNRSNISGGSNNNSAFNGQTIAADTDLKVALAACSSVNQLVRIDGNTFTVTTFLVKGNLNELLKVVIYKGPNRWLVGGTQGGIYEIDNVGNIKDYWAYSLNFTKQFNTTPLFEILNLCIENNFLLVNTYQGSFLMDWSTKTILSKLPLPVTSIYQAAIVCGGASSIAIVGSRSFSNQGVVHALDFSSPYYSATQAYLDTTSALTTVGLNASGYAWTTDNNGRLRCFQVTPNNTVLRTVSATIGGVNYPARVTWVDDSNGASNSQVVNDTYMNSPGTYRIPAGLTLYECIQINDGTTAYFDVTKFNS